MTLRATKRGADRTRLDRDCDVLICGASFAGLTVARELAGSQARILMIDRYDIGERQTSACAAPTEWLAALGLEGSILQSFERIVLHTPYRTLRFSLPFTFSTFDYRLLCAGLRAQGDAEFDTATVNAITRHSGHATQGPLSGSPVHTVHTDRGDLRAAVIVDALGWKRVLSTDEVVSPPHAPRPADARSGSKLRAPTPEQPVRLSRGLEIHPPASGEELEVWIDPRYVRAGYGWSFPAREEVRVGVGSFEPRDHVREPTMRLAGDLGLGLEPGGYQGNWIPHALRPAVADGVFFVGDSAGQCLPLTAEGIRTALYFGVACGRELRAVLDGHQPLEQALARYAAFNEAHAWKFRWLLNTQHAIGAITGRRVLTTVLGFFQRPQLSDWMFRRYLNVAPASFATDRLPEAAIRDLAVTTA